MNRPMNALILFMSLGLKAYGLHDRGIVYGFDNVSPVLCGTTFPGVSSFLISHPD
jgi:hypothetical protein